MNFPLLKPRRGFVIQPRVARFTEGYPGIYIQIYHHTFARSAASHASISDCPGK